MNFEILAQIWKCKKNENCGYGGNTERTGCRNTKLTLKNCKTFCIFKTALLDFSLYILNN